MPTIAEATHPVRTVGRGAVPAGDPLALYHHMYLSEPLQLGLEADAPRFLTITYSADTRFFVEGERFAKIFSDLERISSSTFTDNRPMPNEAAINRAKDFVVQFRSTLLPPECIAPLRDGGIVIVFIQDRKRAEIELLNDGEGFATLFDDSGPIVVREFNNDERIQIVAETKSYLSQS